MLLDAKVLKDSSGLCGEAAERGFLLIPLRWSQRASFLLGVTTSHWPINAMCSERKAQQGTYGWTSHSGFDSSNIPERSTGELAYIKKSGMKMYFQRGTGREVRIFFLLLPQLLSLKGLPLTRRLACLSPNLDMSQQGGSHSIFYSNCLLSHYILLNAGPIPLLTRLAVTSELL